MMSTMTTFAAPLLSPTHSHSHPSYGKARANSDDYNVDRSGVDGSADNLNNDCNRSVSQGSKFHYDTYSLQRAMSSEARLPSRERTQPNNLHEQANDHGGTNEEDDEEEDELQYCPSDGDGLTFSSSNETDEVDGSATHRNRYGIQESGSSHRITPSPRSKKMPTHLQQRQQPKRSASPFGLISRSVSDTTHSGRSTGSAAKQILLQTIESRNNATTTPKPLPRANGIVSISSNNSSATTGSSSPDHKYHPPHHQPQHSNVSFTSHYSVDAGKHGFLSHSPPPSPPPRLHSFSNGDDDSAAGGAGVGGGGDANSVVSNGSLVFKYLPGQETPPAEYALPVSILKVYGDSLIDEIDQHLMNSSSSSSKDIIPPVRRKVFDESLLKENENQRRLEESNTTTSMISSSRSTLPLPPPMTILEDTTTTSGALPFLREEQQRILPYHERKRLSELLVEKEKQRRQKKNAATTANTRNQQQANFKMNGGMVPSASENTPLNGVASGGYGGTTPLLANNNTNNNSNNDVEHGGGNDNVANHVIHPKDTKEWFGQLVSIITGKSAFNIKDAGEDKDPKQTYRDQAEAFLRKTESERMKIKELSSARQKNLDRSWAKRSSISAALDSIPSCSGEEEEEIESDDDDNDTNETYSSSEEEEDEEYGSYYFDNRKGGGGGTNPSATMTIGLNATPKVWRYGEPPITIDRSNSNASLKKKLAAPKKHHHMSEHDLKMRRDRLLQEEYEYRLRALQREHANLSKKFRIFVLVTVAIIFTGALTFAFVVCVRMLMSIK